MKFPLPALALLLAAPLHAADVGVSLTVGQPGFYGSIDISNYPRPQVVNVEPVIIRPVVGVASPVYLHVPPGHARKWSNYCGRYNACGRPVYFVREEWYENTYVPAYEAKHGKSKNKGGGKGPGKSQGNGHGNGNGKGGGNGHR